MLKIVEFIHNHKNWEELLSNEPYFIKIAHDGRYVILSYNQINSDFSNPICLEARGLILDTEDNYKPVRMAFEKFFNIDEKYAANIDWTTASASEKIDGSIMSVWYHNNKWHVSTNNTINARKALINNTEYNFRDIFNIAAVNSGLDFNKLNKNYCYTFELVSPQTTVVISYKETKLYHILTRDMTTLQEISDDIGIEKPKKYEFSNESSIRNIVSELDTSHEGVVVVDGNFNRIKIKTKTYFIMHYLRNNMSFINAMELVRMNDYEEFVSYFTEYKEVFEAMSAIYNQILNDAKELDGLIMYLKNSYEYMYKNSNDFSIIVRKKFAQAISNITNNYIASNVFLAYDGKCYDTLISPITINKFIRLTRNYWIILTKYFPNVFSINEILNV